MPVLVTEAQDLRSPEHWLRNADKPGPEMEDAWRPLAAEAQERLQNRAWLRGPAF